MNPLLRADLGTPDLVATGRGIRATAH